MSEASEDTTKQLPIQAKLSEELKSFLNSPYRGEWDQICTVKLNAGELRILVAHLTTHPIDEDAVKQRLGGFGTIEAANLFRGYVRER